MPVPGVVGCLRWDRRNGSTLLIAVAEVDVVGAGMSAGDLVVAVFGARLVGRGARNSVPRFLGVNRTRTSPIPGGGHKRFV